APTCVDACRYFASLIAGALQGLPKKALLDPAFEPLPGYWQAHPLHPEIEAIRQGSYRHKMPPDIQGSGYVVRSLEAALWACWRHDDFASGALAAVNLGDDADTTGAVYGQLAGALYGLPGIPAGWRERIAMRTHILALADQLLAGPTLA
ncbi:MAG: ADP-ribosylglycohydrolase family protein, partial [Bacteroidetes bacterium]